MKLRAEKLMAGAFTEGELKVLRQDDYFREKLELCSTLSDFELLCDYAFVLLDNEKASIDQVALPHHLISIT